MVLMYPLSTSPPLNPPHPILLQPCCGRAAVRALGWAPLHPGLLASGGGAGDRTLRFWDTTTEVCATLFARIS